MTYAEVEKWVDVNLERKKQEFGLSNWRIQIEYRELETSEDGFKSAACMRSLFQYERAKLTLDPAEFDTVEWLEETVEHELMHVVHSSFDLVYDIARELIKDKKAFMTLREAFNRAEEMTVRNMERMAFGLRNAKPAADA